MSEPGFVVEVLDHHGRAQARHRFALHEGCAEATVGRGIGADVVIDDVHAAALHARIEVDAQGGVRVTDLGSVNGLWVNGKREREVQRLVLPDGGFQIGRTRIKVRTAAETLAPEKPEGLGKLDFASASSRVSLGAGGAFVLYGIYTAWVEAPRDVLAAMVTAVAFSLGAAAVWITAWALLSRMLTGEWRWLRHAAVFFGVMVAAGAVEGLAELGWFALSLRAWDGRALLIGVLGFGGLLYGHLSNSAHLSRRQAIVVAALLPLMIGGTALWVQARNDARNVNHIGLEERVYPAALRLRSGIATEEFFVRASALAERAEKKRKEVPADDGDDEVDFLD